MKRYSRWITDKRRWAIYARDSFTCAYCGKYMRYDPEMLTLDHLKTWHSMAEEGKIDHSSTNLATACNVCNSARGNRPLDSYAPAGSLIRIAENISRPLDFAYGQTVMEDVKLNGKRM